MAEVIDVSIDRARSLTITYDDGVVAAFDLTELRQACPCATCRGRREQGHEPWTTRPDGAAPAIADAEFVGAWGLSIRWDDGHDTGIYAWDLLRSWHERADHDTDHDQGHDHGRGDPDHDHGHDRGDHDHHHDTEDQP